MQTYQTKYMDRIGKEVKQTPEEYLPLLLEVIRLFRQSISLKSAEDSFKQGWKESMQGEIIPISELWTNIDAQ